MKIISQVYKPIGRLINRYKLKKIITRQLVEKTQLKIVVGASGIYEPGWIPTNIDTLNLLNISDWMFYFRREVIDGILAEHVWEHLTEKEGIEAAINCYMYLKMEGYIRIAVPDGFHPDPKYIDYVKPGGNGSGAKDHKILYNFKSLEWAFKYAGFKIDLLEYFDAEGEFHYKDWSAKDGMIHRSKRYDERNRNGLLNYTSLIIDAYKL